ncbi:MAG: Hydrolase, alpha/beta fold family [uncultured Rubrobacteraceae bacterium]|uniref:Hydrolase, alpha/beta fold family n=1 Tax=uncultured Rubrobacteraceae bacterium TaxID=349277 RepID=A0A6J4QL83_9ACTN|nr:MAG: Hydrolase, alpha/beta fold family [uncultured Rubrobacteraceae bacterium]
MAEERLLEGVSSRTIDTGRIRTHLLESGPENGAPVLFVHGNASSGRFFEEIMAALPGHRGLAPDLRGFGGSETKPLDATRGVADFSDDLRALVEALGLGGRPVHLVGWSAGGPVAMQYAIDHPEAVASLVLVNPMSPYGFGGTKDASGTPCWPDFAGSGGGTANPEFVGRVAAGDRTGDDLNSPRNVMNNFYFAPPFKAPPEREEALLSSVLSTQTGDDNYPGDMTTSKNWPGVAPGGRGMNNAISPKYCNVSGFARIGMKPPVLWVRGSGDTIVSDASFLDFGTLGGMNLVPGWPGEAVFPSQPMVSQTRAVLEDYAATGGSYREEVIEGCGHTPHVERPERFRRLLFDFIGGQR